MAKVKFTRRQKIAGLAVFGVVVVLAIAALGLELAYARKIPPRVKIGSVSLGGLDQAAAKQTLVQAINQYKNASILVSFEDNKFPVTSEELAATFEIDKTVEALFSSGSRLKFLIKGPKSQLTTSADPAKRDAYFEKIAKVTDQAAVDASLKITDEGVVELPEKVGKGFDRELLTRELSERLSRLGSEPVSLVVKPMEPRVFAEGLIDAKAETERLLGHKLTVKAAGQEFKIDRDEIAGFIGYGPADEPLVGGKGKPLDLKLGEDKIREWVKKIAKKIDQPLKDARLKLEGEKVSVFSPSQEGRTLDKDKSVLLLKSKLEYYESELELPVEFKKPSVTTESVNDLGIKELIGKGTTSFKGSPQNRKHNIGNGSRFLNGILIRPGEVFSTVEQLGQIDDTTGYLPELVIRENKTIPEFGGGLCQVSTTLFRAALNSGLPIVERQNHSWRIRYYEPPVGLDATVYLPKPDLKIKNDTPGWVLIQGFVQGDNLTFEFYGTKDGRRAELIGPKLLSSTPPPAAEYIDSPDLPEGETKQVEKPHPGGKATVTYRVYDKDSKLINDQTFNSSYKPVPARFLKGTGPKPAPEPPPTPSPEGLTPSPAPIATPSQ